MTGQFGHLSLDGLEISEIKFGRSEQALYYLECMAERILAENGMFAETYRGDRPERFNSCILQAGQLECTSTLCAR